MWLVFLAVHLVGNIGYNLLLRRSLLGNVDRWTLATIMQTGVAIPLVLALFFVRPDFAQYDWRAALITVVASGLVILLHLANVKALQYLEASVFSILYNLRILLTTILGIWFLNEPIVPLQIVGGLLIFMAVIVVRQKGGEKLHVTGIKWGVAAAIVISLLNFVEKHTLAVMGYMDYAIPVMVLTTVVMWGVLLARGRSKALATIKQPRMIQLMVLRTLSAHGALLAFWAGGLLSVVTYVSSLSVVGIVILGVLLLGERDYLKQKIIATSMAVAGLTAILIARLGDTVDGMLITAIASGVLCLMLFMVFVLQARKPVRR